MLIQFADYVVFTLFSLQPGRRGGEALNPEAAILKNVLKTRLMTTILGTLAMTIAIVGYLDNTILLQGR